jgi:hypothetical protein
MPLIVEPKSSFELVAEGTYNSVVVAVFDAGRRWNMQHTKIDQLYLFGIQIEKRDSQGCRFLVSRTCTDTWGQRSVLPAFLATLFGERPKRAVNLETTIGKPFMSTIKHNPAQVDGHLYPKVVATTLLPRGVRPLVPEAFTPPPYWSVVYTPDALPAPADNKPAPRLISQPPPQPKKIEAAPLPYADLTKLEDPQPQAAAAPPPVVQPADDSDVPF